MAWPQPCAGICASNPCEQNLRLQISVHILFRRVSFYSWLYMMSSRDPPTLCKHRSPTHMFKSSLCESQPTNQGEVGLKGNECSNLSGKNLAHCEYWQQQESLKQKLIIITKIIITTTVITAVIPTNKGKFYTINKWTVAHKKKLQWVSTWGRQSPTFRWSKYKLIRHNIMTSWIILC